MRKFFLLSFILLLAACDQPKSPEEKASAALNDLEQLVARADSLGHTYSDEEWLKTDSLFSLYLELSTRGDGKFLSDEQKKTIGKLSGAYTTLRIQESSRMIEERLKEAGLWMEGFFEGVKEQLEKEE